MKTIKNLTAEEIRKSILQLAIQGKLVKQDPSDEPASELVKRIYAEKQKLIKEGKIKKDKNESFIFKGDDNCYYEKVGKSEAVKLEDLPFEIPENWSWIRLSSFCDIYTGDSINENDKNKLYRNRSEGYDYIGTKDVNFNHTIVYENGVKIPYDTQFKICPKSKILLCIEGGSAGRKIAFTSKDVCFGNKLACFNSWIIDDRYLYLFLQSPLFLQLFKDKLTGIISGVSINNLKQLFLPLPPLEEQERIVEKFKSCEPLLSRYELIEQNITLLETSLEEKLKASILQYAIEGKLVKQNPNDEPASVLLERIKAEKEKLISEGKIKRDKNDSIIEQSDDKNYYEKFPLFLPLKNVCSYGLTNYKNPELGIMASLIELDQIISGISKCPDGKEINLNTSTIKSRYYFEKGMILYSKLRPYLDKVILADKNGICSGELVPFWSYINTEWLLLYLHSPKFIQHVNSDSFGVKMPRVKTSTFLNSEIPLYSNEFMSRTLFKLKRCNRIISQF